MSPDTHETFFGDYHLKKLVDEHPLTRVWLAEQASISRQVLMEELRPECFDQKEEFLADVRIKASVDHPLIGSIYEAVAGEDRCFFAYELLPGTTLEDRLREGGSLQPLLLAKLIRRVSEAQLHHEAAGHRTAPLSLASIHLDEHGVVRLGNTAIAGRRDAGQSTADIARLGEALHSLVADGQPGANRMLTLLSWMRGEGLETPLDWHHVSDICSQIEQQLSNASPTGSVHEATRTGSRRGMLLGAGVIAAMVVLLIGWLVIRRSPQATAPAPRAPLPEAIMIPGGSHATPDGAMAELKEFRIAAHEVTIGQYAAFLQTLETLAKNKLERTFDHPEQPAEKTSHVPDGWAALIAAAKANGMWNDRRVTLDTPVSGVDWWDAAAYAEWQHAHLPSQDEWFAALRHQVEQPATIPAADLAPVTDATLDRTPTGLLGMAGSVCEWTREKSSDPANPLGPRQWVVVGGSFLKPSSNALSREWTPDRSLRRADLGFRLIYPQTSGGTPPSPR